MAPEWREAEGEARQWIGALKNGDAIDAHEGLERNWNKDGTIGLLIIFEQRQPGAADGEGGAIEGVDKFAFTRGGFEADGGATGLECFAIGAGGDLHEFTCGGEPDFDVVGFGGSEAHLRGAEKHDAIMQTEALEDLFDIGDEGIELGVTLVWARELEELDLLKLVLAANAAGIATRGARFGTEAGRPGAVADRERFGGEGGIAVEAGELDLRGGSEPKVCAFAVEHVRSELGKLADASESSGVDEEGRKDFAIAALAGMNLEHEMGECAFETRAQATIDGKARPRHFGGGLKIEDAGALAELPMREGSEIEVWRRAPAADFDIVCGGISDRDGRVREIGDGEHKLAEGGIEFGDAEVAETNLVTDLLHAGEDDRGVAALAFGRDNLFAGEVALGFELFGGGDEGAALGIDGAEALEIERDMAVEGHLFDEGEMIADEGKIEHSGKG